VTRYELLDRIGVGGMAEIFRAKAVAAGGFEKPVAIKRILPHLSQDRRFVQLLIAEAKVLSQLRHRNIVQIFDVGLGDDGQYFLVMEFVDGTDLGAVQKTLEPRRRRLPLDLVLHIGAEVCEALEHAHKSKGPDGQPMRLVHRDVSPSNVLLSRAGEVKLTDFGIAKRAEEHTGHGAVRGKFAYISPEQARNEPVDGRSDVFSVGVLLYELCLGKRLYSALPDLEALRAVRDAKVPRPSEVDATLSPEIEKLLLAALARDPALRPAGAGQLGAMLRSIRYSLDEPAGDPATELGKIVDNVGQRGGGGEIASIPAAKPAASGKPRKDGFESVEPTALRIRTADEFQDSDGEGTSVLKARELLARFEEEETRMSQIGDAGRMRNPRDSGELTQAATPQAIFQSSDEDSMRFMSASAARIDEEDQTVDEHEERTRFARPGSGDLRPPGRPGRGPASPKGKQRGGRPTTKPPPVPPQPSSSRPFDPANEPTTLGEPAWSPSHAPPPPPPPVGGRPASGTKPPPPGDGVAGRSGVGGGPLGGMAGGAGGLPGLGPPPMPGAPAGMAVAPNVPGAPPVANPGGAFGGFGPPNPNPAYGPGPGGGPPALANPPPGAAFDARGRALGPAGGPIAAATARPDPTAHDRYDATAGRHPAHRSSMPFVEGFSRADDTRRTMLLVVGAIITGILGFAITRAIIGNDDGKASTNAIQDAAPAVAPDAAPDAKTTGAAGSGSGSSTNTSTSTTAPAAAGSGSAAPVKPVVVSPAAGSGSGAAGASSGSAATAGSGSATAPVTKVTTKPTTKKSTKKSSKKKKRNR
jgi:serine/threonine protein kinase